MGARAFSEKTTLVMVFFISMINKFEGARAAFPGMTISGSSVIPSRKTTETVPALRYLDGETRKAIPFRLIAAWKLEVRRGYRT